MIHKLSALVGVVGMLSIGSTGHAATLVFDVSGTGSVNSVHATAPSPGYFTTALGPGSSVSIETDTNGDSIVGDVSLLDCTLNTSRFFDLGGLGTIRTNTLAHMTGGAGALIGGDLFWSSPTSVIEVGTFRCSGAVCGLAGLVPGVDYPIGGFKALTYFVPFTDAVPLGRWELDAAMTTILGSSRAVYSRGGPTPPGAGNPAEWYVSGSNDLGFPVPEPSVFALLLFGVGRVAARRCKGPDQSPDGSF